MRGAGVDHAGDGVVPKILLGRESSRAWSRQVGEHLVVRMPPADAGRLHRARRSEIGRPQAHPVHSRRGGGDRLDVVDALRRLEDRVDEDRLPQSVPRLEQGKLLIDKMDVPVPFDLGDHHDVELVADFADERGHVVEEPGRVQRIDARPQAG